MYWDLYNIVGFQTHLKYGEQKKLLALIPGLENANIVRQADKWATWIVFIALIMALGTWLITGQIIRAVTVLVVFCPCGLVLATPTAIVAANGNLSKLGILVSDEVLEEILKEYLERNEKWKEY